MPMPAQPQQRPIINSKLPINPSFQPSRPQSSASSNGTRTLSDILVTMGALDPERARQVKLAEVQSGKTEEEILVSQNLVNEVFLTRAKAEAYNVPYIDLTNVPVSPEALSSLPQEVAKKFNVFPVAIDPISRQIIVAMIDPLNLTAIQFIEQKTGMQVKPHAAEPSKIILMLETSYTTSLAKEVSEALREVPSEEKVRTINTGQTGLIREEKVAEVVTHILEFAAKARASDIHIEPQEKSTRVRYRIDGILQEKLTIPRELHDALISRIKILSGMKIDEKRVPQDGRFNFRTETEEVDLRVSTLPTSWGEKIVMRLLKKTGGVPSLGELGLRGRALKNLEEAILRPHGIILICGPTGSGKTTTLYSIIQKISTPKVNIVTLEDPIEYKIQGVNQVQVNPVAGLTFASGLRAFLRQDPNIILVGEIRDQETADLAVQAALTGHLVFSTLHTNNAAGALPRLLDMGAEPYLLASSMTAIVAQRVVRKIHEPCKASYVPEAKVVDDMKQVLGSIWPKTQSGGTTLYKGQGDADCGNSGYWGRFGIFEVLPVSEKISRLILERASAAEIEKLARDEAMITMKQDGYLKVLEGATTLEEVLRVAQE
jgi:type IV pilus assembly protein PilB